MDLFFNGVKEFHETFDCPVRQDPVVPTREVADRRIFLIREELQELQEAMAGEGLPARADRRAAIAKELTDLLYVVIGTYLELGLHPLAAPLFREVHSSNMTKTLDNESDAIRFAADHQRRTGQATSPRKTKNGRWTLVRDRDGKIIKPPTYRPADTRQVLIQFYQAYIEGLRATGQAVSGLPEQEPGKY